MESEIDVQKKEEKKRCQKVPKSVPVPAVKLTFLFVVVVVGTSHKTNFERNREYGIGRMVVESYAPEKLRRALAVSPPAHPTRVTYTWYLVPDIYWFERVPRTGASEGARPQKAGFGRSLGHTARPVYTLIWIPSGPYIHGQSDEHAHIGQTLQLFPTS